MKASDIESWALAVIDRVEKGQPIEDARVEAKADWIDPQPMARRIAGHANAARGEPVLWLIGVDEKGACAPGASPRDAADWWPQVKACFDRVFPQMTDVGVPHGGGTVVALLFETDRAPFVVKNPDGGKIGFEVPWREGTSVRSARREDLMRILVPAATVPDAEVLRAELRHHDHSISASQLLHDAAIDVRLYVHPRSGRCIFVPFHRCCGYVVLGGRRFDFEEVQLAPTTDYATNVGSLTIAAGLTELRIEGPGGVTVTGTLGAKGRSAIDSGAVVLGDLLEVGFDLAVLDNDLPWLVRAQMKPVRPVRGGLLGAWVPQQFGAGEP